MARPVGELVTDSKMKIMLIGDAGVGKTFLSGTAGAHKDLTPLLVLSLEGGLESITHMPGVYYEEIDSIAKLEEIWKSLNDRGGEWDGIKYKSVAIDSASEMQTLDVDEIVASKAGKRSVGSGKSRSVDDVYLEDYGTSTRRLARIFRAFRNLNMHTIFTCLPKYTRSESGNAIMSIDPLLTPKLAGLFRGYMSYVWYIYISPDPKQPEVDKRWLMTESNGIIKCKTRGHGFNEYLRKTFKHIVPQEYMHLGWLYEKYVKSQTEQRDQVTPADKK